MPAVDSDKVRYIYYSFVDKIGIDLSVKNKIKKTLTFKQMLSNQTELSEAIKNLLRTHPYDLQRIATYFEHLDINNKADKALVDCYHAVVFEVLIADKNPLAQAILKRDKTLWFNCMVPIYAMEVNLLLEQWQGIFEKVLQEDNITPQDIQECGQFNRENQPKTSDTWDAVASEKLKELVDSRDLPTWFSQADDPNFLVMREFIEKHPELRNDLLANLVKTANVAQLIQKNSFLEENCPAWVNETWQQTITDRLLALVRADDVTLEKLVAFNAHFEQAPESIRELWYGPVKKPEQGALYRGLVHVINAMPEEAYNVLQENFIKAIREGRHPDPVQLLFVRAMPKEKIPDLVKSVLTDEPALQYHDLLKVNKVMMNDMRDWDDEWSEALSGDENVRTLLVDAFCARMANDPKPQGLAKEDAMLFRNFGVDKILSGVLLRQLDAGDNVSAISLAIYDEIQSWQPQPNVQEKAHDALHHLKRWFFKTALRLFSDDKDEDIAMLVDQQLGAGDVDDLKKKYEGFRADSVNTWFNHLKDKARSQDNAASDYAAVLLMHHARGELADFPAILDRFMSPENVLILQAVFEKSLSGLVEANQKRGDDQPFSDQLARLRQGVENQYQKHHDWRAVYIAALKTQLETCSDVQGDNPEVMQALEHELCRNLLEHICTQFNHNQSARYGCFRRMHSRRETMVTDLSEFASNAPVLTKDTVCDKLKAFAQEMCGANGQGHQFGFRKEKGSLLYQLMESAYNQIADGQADAFPTIASVKHPEQAPLKREVAAKKAPQ